MSEEDEAVGQEENSEAASNSPKNGVLQDDKDLSGGEPSAVCYGPKQSNRDGDLSQTPKKVPRLEFGTVSPPSSPGTIAAQALFKNASLGSGCDVVMRNVHKQAQDEGLSGELKSTPPSAFNNNSIARETVTSICGKEEKSNDSKAVAAEDVQSTTRQSTSNVDRVNTSHHQADESTSVLSAHPGNVLYQFTEHTLVETADDNIDFVRHSPNKINVITGKQRVKKSKHNRTGMERKLKNKEIALNVEKFWNTHYEITGVDNSIEGRNIFEFFISCFKVDVEYGEFTLFSNRITDLRSVLSKRCRVYNAVPITHTASNHHAKRTHQDTEVIEQATTPSAPGSIT